MRVGLSAGLGLSLNCMNNKLTPANFNGFFPDMFFVFNGRKIAAIRFVRQFLFKSWAEVGNTFNPVNKASKVAMTALRNVC